MSKEIFILQKLHAVHITADNTETATDRVLVPEPDEINVSLTYRSKNPKLQPEHAIMIVEKLMTQAGNVQLEFVDVVNSPRDTNEAIIEKIAVMVDGMSMADTTFRDSVKHSVVDALMKSIGHLSGEKT